MVKPVSPGEVVVLKKKYIPDGVIEAFNLVIAKHYTGRSATFKQDEVVDLIVKTMGFERHEVFANKWLDVEELYEAEGWKVKYDKPAYCETYDATFTFKKA